MKASRPLKYYGPVEEKLNVVSHALGFGLSIPGFIFLIYRAAKLGEMIHLISFSIFGGSLILLYAASTFYHGARNEKLRYRLNILDHAAIYVLIAGTYTPFALITLSGTVGWIIFAVVWTMALTGMILKLFFTGRFERLSTAMYVFMGWIIVFAVKPLIQNLPEEGLIWLFAGGISYTIGAVAFSIERIKFNHALFHLFVLVGSFCHFLAICFHVLPEN